MLCIRGEQLLVIETALGELLHNRQHLELHPDDRKLLEDAEKEVKEVRAMTASEAQRQAAHDEYGQDDIEIDDEAAVSETDEGYWVSAWVFVREEPDACEDCGNTLNDGSDTCDQCGGAFKPQEG